MPDTLGCAERYNVIIHYQGGELPYYQIPVSTIAEVTWQRILDDTSTGTVRIKRSEVTPECCEKIGSLDCFGFELSIYRDDNLVWQGPIIDVLEDPNEITIEAKDVIGYLDNRMNNIAYNFVNQDIGALFFLMVDDGFSLQDPNVMPYTNISVGALSLDWAADINSVYVGDELREVAKAGYDFTTMGRAIVGRNERAADEYLTTSPILTHKHFAGQLQVRRTGTVTRATVIGNGVQVTLGGPVDPFYGVVDVIEHMDKITDTAVLSLAAAHLVNDGNPTPTYIVLPPEAKLLPTAPVTVAQLMPSERIDIYITEGFCRQVQQSFKLLQVNGRWNTETGESIGINVGPLPPTAGL